MAKGDQVREGESIVRLTRPSDVKLGKLSGTAFERTKKDTDGLSVCRRGVFSDDAQVDLDAIRAALASRLVIKPAARLAQLSVADILAIGREVGEVLSVVQDPLPEEEGKSANPAHALILDLPFKGAEEGELGGVLASDLLARRVADHQLYPAV